MQSQNIPKLFISIQTNYKSTATEMIAYIKMTHITNTLNTDGPFKELSSTWSSKLPVFCSFSNTFMYGHTLTSVIFITILPLTMMIKFFVLGSMNSAPVVDVIGVFGLATLTFMD